jgi:hypothetical protein
MHSTSIHLGFSYVSSHIFALDSAHHAVAILFRWTFYFGSISPARHAKDGRICDQNFATLRGDTTE